MELRQASNELERCHQETHIPRVDSPPGDAHKRMAREVVRPWHRFTLAPGRPTYLPRHRRIVPEHGGFGVGIQRLLPCAIGLDGSCEAMLHSVPTRYQGSHEVRSYQNDIFAFSPCSQGLISEQVRSSLKRTGGWRW